MQFYQNNPEQNGFDFSYNEARTNQLKGLRKSLTALGILLIIYFVLLIAASEIYPYLYAGIHSGSLMLNFSEISNYIRGNDSISVTEYEMFGNAFIVIISLAVTVISAKLFFHFDFKQIFKTEKNSVIIGVKAYPFSILVNYIFVLIATYITAQFASVGVTIPEAEFEIDRPTLLAGVAMFTYTVIIAPIAEEIIYRGLVIRLISPYGKKLAVFLSAFIFGFMHGNLSQFMSAFSTGLIYSIIAVYTGSIVPTIVMHILNNTPNFIVMASSTYSVGWLETVYYVIFACTLLVGVMEIFFYAKRFFRLPPRDETLLTAKERVRAIFTNPAMIIYFIFLAFEFISNIIRANI